MIRSLLCLLLGLCPALALARSYDLYKEDVAKVYQKGLAAFNRNDYKRAILHFQEALDLVRRAKTDTPSEYLDAWKKSEMAFLLRLGSAYERDQQPKEAWKRYFRGFLLQAHKGLTAQAQKALSELEEKGTRVTIPFRLQTAPPQADVLITDAQGRKIQGQTPLALPLSPGPVEIRLSRPGYQPLSLRLELPWDGPFEKTYSLERIAEVRRRPPPPPPRRRVLPRLPPPPPPGPSARDIAFPIVASLAVASILTATVLTVIYSQENSALYQIQQNPASTYQSNMEICSAFDNDAFGRRAQTNQNLLPLLWTFWGASVALGTTSMILLFLPRKPSPPPNLPSDRSVLLLAR